MSIRMKIKTPQAIGGELCMVGNLGSLSKKIIVVKICLLRATLHRTLLFRDLLTFSSPCPQVDVQLIVILDVSDDVVHCNMVPSRDLMYKFG